jgi:hypothetical protein
MKRRLFIGLPLAVFVVVCGWQVYRALFCNAELASKVEWSIVQAVESQHSDKHGDKVELVNMSGYSLVGIPVDDSRKEVWIMLNPRNPPYYKQLPKGTYTISGEDLKKILASGDVVPTVVNCLESHVQDSK